MRRSESGPPLSKYHVHALDANHKAIVETLKAHGLAWEPLGRPVDGMVSWGGQTHLVEFKTPTGKLRASQQAFIARWRAPVAILRSVDEATAFVQRVKGKR